jgi:hypothetical protein
LLISAGKSIGGLTVDVPPSRLSKTLNTVMMFLTVSHFGMVVFFRVNGNGSAALGAGSAASGTNGRFAAVEVGKSGCMLEQCSTLRNVGSLLRKTDFRLPLFGGPFFGGSPFLPGGTSTLLCHFTFYFLLVLTLGHGYSGDCFTESWRA